jgi:(heptosyl)LPS beta-1,4-glucosyltransferase
VKYANVGHWNIKLEHNTARSASEYQRKLEKYARIWASSRPALSFGTLRGIASASAYLIRNLILRIGILDGPKAWQFHWLHARYSFLKYRLLAKR